MVSGITGKILRVDLTNGSITTDEHDEAWYRTYLGGSGIVAYYMLNEIPQGIDPFDPENVLIYGLGPMTGLAMPGASRMSIGTKSPLTGGFMKSEAGGFWPNAMKQCGYDAVVITGKSEKPIYLLATPDSVELKDASHLWGKTCAETLDMIEEETGIRNIRTSAIGAGGENMVRYACVINDLKDAAGRGGAGAVMGSKNLKALAAQDGKPQAVADQAKIREMTLWMNRDADDNWKSGGMHKEGTGGDGAMIPGNEIGNMPSHNFYRNDFPNVAKITATRTMADWGVGMEGCAACALRCKKMVKVEEPWNVLSRNGGPEYESLAALGSTCGVDDLPAILKANELANLYSLDTISLGVSIAFGMECFENEILNLQDTGGIDLKFGNAEALVQMVELIAKREGIGDILADGSRKAAERIGQGSEEFAMHVKGLEFPMHDPRVKQGLGIMYSVEAVGADHCAGFHDPMFTTESVAFTRLRALGARRPLPADDLSADKVANAKANHIKSMFGDSMVCCSFVPWSLDQQVEILNAATGWSYSIHEVYELGQRIATLGRIFNMREGMTAADDVMPKRMFEPTPTGGLKDGGIDKTQMDAAVKTFYGMMGWDEVTGVPTNGKLSELNISWAAEHIPADRSALSR